MSLAAPSLLTGSLFTVAATVIPKSAGSIARVQDTWNAKAPLRENTIKGEALTLGQVGAYALIGNTITNVLQSRSPQLEKLAEKNRPLLTLLVIPFLSNELAEQVSRVFFSRKIDANNQVVSKKRNDNQAHRKPATVSQTKAQSLGVASGNCRQAASKNPFVSQEQGAQEIMFAHAPKQPLYETRYTHSPFQLSTVRASF